MKNLERFQRLINRAVEGLSARCGLTKIATDAIEILCPLSMFQKVSRRAIHIRTYMCVRP